MLVYTLDGICREVEKKCVICYGSIDNSQRTVEIAEDLAAEVEAGTAHFLCLAEVVEDLD